MRPNPQIPQKPVGAHRVRPTPQKPVGAHRVRPTPQKPVGAHRVRPNNPKIAPNPQKTGGLIIAGGPIIIASGRTQFDKLTDHSSPLQNRPAFGREKKGNKGYRVLPAPHTTEKLDKERLF